MPPERELSRRIAVIVGGGSGIGREVAIEMAALGAHVVVDRTDRCGAEAVGGGARTIVGGDGDGGSRWTGARARASVGAQ